MKVTRGVRPGAERDSFIRKLTLRQYPRNATRICASTRFSIW